jgi:predicted nuclease of restriction endonuclease-like (RecB) superfamily
MANPPARLDSAFDEVVQLVEAARRRATRQINVELIDLYWRIGEVISQRIANDGWGKGTVEALSAHLRRTQPGMRGFSPQNLWRMRKFFETYRGLPDLSLLMRELSWSANLQILGRTKRAEEREFYLRMAARNGWDVRELSRHIGAALFERSMLTRPKLSTALRELHPRGFRPLQGCLSD